VAKKAINDAIAISFGDFNRKDYDKFIDEFYTDDASGLMPNVPILNGKAAMNDFMKERVATRILRSKLRPRKWPRRGPGTSATRNSALRRSGLTPRRKITMANGNWITAFQQESDGSMRAVEDMFNADGSSQVMMRTERSAELCGPERVIHRPRGTPIRVSACGQQARRSSSRTELLSLYSL